MLDATLQSAQPSAAIEVGSGQWAVDIGALAMHGGSRRRGRYAGLRRGVSLLEILVAIFIMSVGLLGVAALIPVGNSEVIKASIAHRSAETGLRAFREMKLRGYLNPQNWLAGGTAVVDADTGVMRQEFSGMTFAIDPLTSQGAGGQAIPHLRNVKTLTLRSSMATETNKTAPPMPASVAERVFIGQDNLIFDRPKEQTRPPMQFREGGSGARRRTQPNYSWLAMLTPMQVLPSGNLAPEFKLDTYLMSVVVFYKDTPGTAPRRALRVSAEPLGGNEFTFRIEDGDEDSKKFLRPRRWVLLSDNQQVYRWYRIGSVEGSVAEDKSERKVSLLGPDWDVSSGAGQPQAVVFESVVAVIEKVVQLEGQTMWSPGASPTTGRK